MDLTNVDVKNLKTLEQYAITLVTGMMSLKTLENFHIKAVNEGLLPEDLNCRANTIVWDIRRDLKLYQEQLDGVLELVGDSIDVKTIIESLKPKKAVKRAVKKKEKK